MAGLLPTRRQGRRLVHPPQADQLAQLAPQPLPPAFTIIGGPVSAGCGFDGLQWPASLLRLDLGQPAQPMGEIRHGHGFQGLDLCFHLQAHAGVGRVVQRRQMLAGHFQRAQGQVTVLEQLHPQDGGTQQEFDFHQFLRPVAAGLQLRQLHQRVLETVIRQLQGVDPLLQPGLLLAQGFQCAGLGLLRLFQRLLQLFQLLPLAAFAFLEKTQLLLHLLQRPLPGRCNLCRLPLPLLPAQPAGQRQGKQGQQQGHGGQPTA